MRVGPCGARGGRRKRNLRARKAREDIGQFKGSFSPEVACLGDRAKSSRFSAYPVLWGVAALTSPPVFPFFSEGFGDSRAFCFFCYLGFSTQLQ